MKIVWSEMWVLYLLYFVIWNFEVQENNLKKSFGIFGRLILVCYFIVYQLHVNRINYWLTTVMCSKVPFLLIL